MVIFSTADRTDSALPISMSPTPHPAVRPSRSFERVRHLVWLAGIPFSYLLAVQSGLYTVPRAWRWDARDFHEKSQFHLSTLPPSDHLYALSSSSSSAGSGRTFLTSNSTLRATSPPPQLEFVMSYYDEPMSGVADMIRRAYAEVPHWSKKTTIYHKGLQYAEEGTTEEQVEQNLRSFFGEEALKGLVDVVAASKNEGRDGGTYLTHM